jgi:hypothetical protein
VQDVEYHDDGFPYCRSCAATMSESLAKSPSGSFVAEKSVAYDADASCSSSTGVCKICHFLSKVFVDNEYDLFVNIVKRCRMWNIMTMDFLTAVHAQPPCRRAWQNLQVAHLSLMLPTIIRY